MVGSRRELNAPQMMHESVQGEGCQSVCGGRSWRVQAGEQVKVLAVGRANRALVQLCQAHYSLGYLVAWVDVDALSPVGWVCV